MGRLKEYLKKEYIETKEDFNSINISKLEKNRDFVWIFLIISFLFYEIQYYFWPDFITNYFLNTLKLPMYAYFIILDIITILVVVLTYKNELKVSYNHFKKNIKDFIKYLFYTLIAFSFLNFIVAITCNLIVGEIPNNQTAIEKLNYGYLIFSCIIYAPIVEELIYRGFFRKFIKNDKMFIIISGLVFGFAHVIGSSSLIQYIYIFDYGLCGAYLAFLYTKYNNIYLNMTAHFTINLIGTIGIILRLIFI